MGTPPVKTGHDIRALAEELCRSKPGDRDELELDIPGSTIVLRDLDACLGVREDVAPFAIDLLPSAMYSVRVPGAAFSCTLFACCRTLAPDAVVEQVMFRRDPA